MRRLLMASAALCALFSPAHAADFNPVKGVSNAVVMSGNILLGDDDKLAKVLAYRAKRHLNTLLFLASDGGSVKASLGMASLIETAHIPVAVAPGDDCASACTILFAAAPVRYVSIDAHIGVHQASEDSGSGTPTSDTSGALGATEAMTAAFIHFNVPFAITRAMTSTPGDQVYWVSPYDLANWPNTRVVPKQ